MYAGYTDTVRKLVKALSESIELEDSGASELEVGWGRVVVARYISTALACALVVKRTD